MVIHICVLGLVLLELPQHADIHTTRNLVTYPNQEQDSTRV
jgi:hypothetical protein